MANDSDKRLGKYLLKSRLGQGGMGVVYLATDTRLQRDVALKVLPKELTADEAAVKRFLREARVAARLNHPNVVAVYDVDQQRGHCFLVMELVNGQTAAELISHGPLPWLEATRFMAEVCRGLAAAHEAGLVHRDIKPSNIMQTNTGQVKLADFGLAKPADDSLSAKNPLTQSGTILGTPHYMSPEQCRGEPVDARSDLYSLGATYFALLTGQPPFSDSQPLQVMFAHCSKPVPDPRALRPELPAECAAIVMKSLAKKRADRFASAQDMLVALNGLLTDAASMEFSLSPRNGEAGDKEASDKTSISAGATTRVPTVAGNAVKHDSTAISDSEATRPLTTSALMWNTPRGMPWWLVAVGAAILIGVGVWWSNSGRDERLPSELQVKTNAAEVNSGNVAAGPLSLSRSETLEFAKEWTDIGTIRCIAFAHDGQSLFTGSRDGRLQRWRIDGNEAADSLLKSPGSVDAVAASQRWLAAGGEDKDLWLWDFTSQRPPVKLAILPTPILSLAISPDGKRLAVGTNESVELYELHDEGARHLRQIGTANDSNEMPCYMVFGLRFSEDSRWLAATSWTKAVGVWDARTGDLQAARRDLAHQPMSVAFVPGKDQVVFGSSDKEGLFMWKWKIPDSSVDPVPGSQERSVRSLVVSRDGIVVVNGEWDGPIQRYDLEHGTVLPTIKRPTNVAAYALAVSPDGRHIAAGGGHHQDSRGFLHLWKVVPAKDK